MAKSWEYKVTAVYFFIHAVVGLLNIQVLKIASFALGIFETQSFNVQLPLHFIHQAALPGDSERTFWSTSQATACHTQWMLHNVTLIAEHQAGKL